MLFIIKTDKANKQADGRDGRTSSRPSFKIVLTKFMNSVAVVVVFVVAATSGNLFNLLFGLIETNDLTFICISREKLSFLSLSLSLSRSSCLAFCCSVVPQLLPIGGKLTQRLVAISERSFLLLSLLLLLFFGIATTAINRSSDQAIKRTSESCTGHVKVL